MKRITFKQNQNGGVLVFLLGAVGIIGMLTMGLFQIMDGPASSAQGSQKIIQAKSEMDIALKTLTQSAFLKVGDCDNDGYQEPHEWRTGTGSAPTGGGTIPLDVGGTLYDPWGTPYGYCAWDVGSESDHTYCNGSSANRLDGSNDPTADEVQAQTMMALISAGPDKSFDTTCAAYADGTTDTITSTDDDIVMRNSYRQSQNSLFLSCPDVTAGMTATETLAPMTTLSTFSDRDADITIDFTATMPDPLAYSLLWEGGGTGYGAAMWIDPPNLYFASGLGTDLTTTETNVWIEYDIDHYAGKNLRITTVIGTDAPGSAGLYINNCLVGRTYTTTGKSLSYGTGTSGLWTGSSGAGFGTQSSGVREPLNGAAVPDYDSTNGSLDTDLNLYANQKPAYYPE